MEFVVGQRWVSQAEPLLGLGIVIEADSRHITVSFPASEEERMYAARQAPLARVSFEPGESFDDVDGNHYTVVDIEQVNGVNYYLAKNAAGEEQIVPEPRLAGTIQLNSPSQRLFSGQFDRNTYFALRVAALHFRHQQQCASIGGLIGPRTSLLPHQVYIAHEVGSRTAPRVLLADEVGLGKTIEAGLILHQQLHNGLASRALVIVPEPLLHQWLVEMLRKFNLHFSLFDAERIASLQASDEDDEFGAATEPVNPFETEQLVLCSLELLVDDPQLLDYATQADWDLLIVDEAHHLHWSETASSPEYDAVAQLAAQCAGLLLLTATPEQLGVESHFARLQLLDPARFHSLPAFVEEQQQFVQINAIVRSLQGDGELDESQQAQLRDLPGFDASLALDTLDTAKREQLIGQLLDQHGTGRVLFRNTRAAIQGFPQRRLHSYPLAASIASETPLFPERALQEQGSDWLAADPRVEWLVDFLKQQRPAKVLVICAHAQTAIDLEKHLHLNTGIRSAAFYEHLSIVERDRAAAYFADDEMGAQALICSEIGSEGRNFQFAHHLVLFDLPENPDLLEQRIGRLDRIGQQHDVQIHVPYWQGSAQEYLFRWYHEGLNAFCESFSAGASMREAFADRLQPWLAGAANGEDFDALLEATRQHCTALRETLEAGRDQLLELNSCDPVVAAELIEAIRESERGETLQSFMTMAFDNLGVDVDAHSEHAMILRPTERVMGHLPGLRDEGTTATFSRELALAREDMEFLSWEHPLVTDTMELICGAELGNACITSLNLKSLPAGTLLLECIFTMQTTAPRRYQIERYLPATPIRVLIDGDGRLMTDTIKHSQLNKLRVHIKKPTRLAIIKQVRETLQTMLASAQTEADRQAAELISSAAQLAQDKLGGELQRLQSLKAKHGAIRDDEIAALDLQLGAAMSHIDGATAELQAVRVIVNTQ